ncbi:unnamed protein product, partial [marine sediment metagenome]
MNVQEAFDLIERIRREYGLITEKAIEPMRREYALAAEKAAAHIVRAYLLEPRQTPMLTAAVLDPFLL